MRTLLTRLMRDPNSYADGVFFQPPDYATLSIPDDLEELALPMPLPADLQ
jgi:hypothetical protein